MGGKRFGMAIVLLMKLFTNSLSSLKKNKEFFIKGCRKILGSYSVNQKEVTRVVLISEHAIPALGIGPRECLIFQIHL